LLVVIAGFARFFDIVNGFLNRCRGARLSICVARRGLVVGVTHIHVMYLAEIIFCTIVDFRLYAGLSLMVWILKREVRAFGGCLGTYRR
jgi:hypothetical protein